MGTIVWFPSRLGVPSVVEEMVGAIFNKGGRLVAYAILTNGGHLVAYAILALLTRYALLHTGESNGFWRRHATFGALLISALYGAFDEYRQSFVPGRDPEFLDVVVDTVGALLGLLGHKLSPRPSPGIRPTSQRRPRRLKGQP